jgi:hypothetical protein
MPRFYFSIEFALTHGHRAFFSITVVELLAWLVFGGLNNLCAAHRFPLWHARGYDGMPGAGGFVRWVCGDMSEAVPNLHFNGVPRVLLQVW